MTNETPLIVFDLDGTLIDTAPDLLDSIQHVATADGLPTIDRSGLRNMVGFGGRVLLNHVYQTANIHLTEAKLDRLVKDFVEHYADNMPGVSAPFDGLKRSMDAMKAHGFKFAVCTNKTELLANKLLDALDMSQLFETVTGQDTFSVRKPHPDHLLKTIEKADYDPRFAVMVGDSPTDFSTAKAAVIPCIGVEFGYCDTPLSEFGLAKIISHYDEMTPQLILELIQNR